ncbi:hypothetical protein [Paraburkholderia fungorum]|nr:hypothetical protein [Paraburkholderia fungorum]
MPDQMPTGPRPFIVLPRPVCIVVRIAQVLQSSVDALVGLEPLTAPRIHNPRLHALYEQMDSLSDEDQQALIVLMDSLVKRSQMTRLMTS